MYIAVYNVLRVIKDGFRLIGKYYLHLAAALLYKLTVIRDIVHSGELVLILPEELTVFLKREHVAVRIHSCLVYLVKAYEAVAYLV